MASRMGEGTLRSRMCGEAIIREAYQQSYPFQDGPYIDQSWPVRGLEKIMKWSGLHHRAKKNFGNIRVARKKIPVSPSKNTLTAEVRILHITDLHLDFDPGVLDRLERIIREVSYDVAVLTGDYNDLVIDEKHVRGEWYQRLGHMFDKPVYAVMGNHDFLWTVPYLEDNGIRVLMNEGLPLSAPGGEIYLAGVDDPRMFRSHDLSRALNGYGGNLPLVLLAHAPQIYEEVKETPVDLMLCGHTHGGQVCWPGGVPLLNRFSCPRSLVSGYWQVDQLQGYTSNGCGGCKLPYRLNAPAEVALLTLCPHF